MMEGELLEVPSLQALPKALVLGLGQLSQAQRLLLGPLLASPYRGCPTSVCVSLSLSLQASFPTSQTLGPGR